MDIIQKSLVSTSLTSDMKYNNSTEKTIIEFTEEELKEIKECGMLLNPKISIMNEQEDIGIVGLLEE